MNQYHGDSNSDSRNTDTKSDGNAGNADPNTEPHGYPLAYRSSGVKYFDAAPG